MIKLNRVGNKLALAGLIGILLSIGVVANQMHTEAEVIDANRRADVQQQIADGAREADALMRSMQTASQSLRIAITTPEMDKSVAEIKAAKAAQDTIIDGNIAIALRQENRDNFARIKVLTTSYVAAADEIAALQKKLLDLYRTRNVAVLDWNRHLEQMRLTTAVTAAPNWAEVENHLKVADNAVNAVQAAAWRYASLNEIVQKGLIVTKAKVLNDALAKASVIEDSELVQNGLTQLSTDMRKFMAATEQAIQVNDQKTDIVRKTLTPTAASAGELVSAAVATARTAVADARNQAAATLERSGQINLSLGLAVVAVLAGTMVFSFMGVARPMTRLNGAMGKMAAGDLDVVIPGARRGDEIGDIAKTVAVIRDNAEQKAREEAEARVERDTIAAAARRREMVQLADGFEQAVGNIVENVSSASTQLEQSASGLTATAEQGKQLTTAVASASDEASTNVQAVASSTEEMSSSVNEISRQVQESATIANSAVEQARKTNDRVLELAQAAARIGDVVDLINTIAGQTNLLALNATIEAARAGDAGRGFAVVAAEVKALADQTAKATGEISTQISGIQAATQQSVGAIKEIGDTIGRMSEIASTIASAVEEQGAATQEIARNVQQAAHGTMEVSANIADVQRGATATGSASSQVLSAAQSLSNESARLKHEVTRFLDSVRAA
ncbi:methyl-accepting chemotaxis protein [Tardiphaga alba]|uniref:Methyl-accepting chemotaxis protein n=1 Tax=Tardiphaga alba TaxID=340268 RepID=A0ABX8AFK4_9BRAD|nr:HAMP domain-containing methyl-accepting chemotaxis protein [Tardiphaga alba]QUS41696.1 methyl-accepting chemotaxis protein [Tardiphaga alba]